MTPKRFCCVCWWIPTFRCHVFFVKSHPLLVNGQFCWLIKSQLLIRYNLLMVEFRIHIWRNRNCLLFKSQFLKVNISKIYQSPNVLIVSITLIFASDMSSFPGQKPFVFWDTPDALSAEASGDFFLDRQSRGTRLSAQLPESTRQARKIRRISKLAGWFSGKIPSINGW